MNPRDPRFFTTGGTVTAISASGFAGWLRVSVDTGAGRPLTSLTVPADQSALWYVGQALVLHGAPVVEAPALPEAGR